MRVVRGARERERGGPGGAVGGSARIPGLEPAGGRLSDGVGGRVAGNQLLPLIK